MKKKDMINWLSEQKRMWQPHYTKNHVKGYEALSNPDIMNEARRSSGGGRAGSGSSGNVNDIALALASHFAAHFGSELRKSNAELVARLTQGNQESGGGTVGSIPVTTTGERILDPTVVDTASSAALGGNLAKSNKIRKSVKPSGDKEELKKLVAKFIRSKDMS